MIIFLADILIEGMLPLRRQSYKTDLEIFKYFRTSAGVRIRLSSLFSITVSPLLIRVNSKFLASDDNPDLFGVPELVKPLLGDDQASAVFPGRM